MAFLDSDKANNSVERMKANSVMIRWLSVSEFSSVEKANQFCDYLRTVIDKHAPLLCGKL